MALLVLHTAAGADQQSLVDLSGCETVDNGAIKILIPESPEELMPGHPHGSPPSFGG
jgi:hypothetical protein